MIKKNLKFSFVCKTTRYNLNKLLSALKKRQNLDSDIISATEAQTPSGQIVKLVFVRNSNNRKEFITLLCTDTSLTSEKIVEPMQDAGLLNAALKHVNGIYILTKNALVLTSIPLLL